MNEIKFSVPHSHAPYGKDGSAFYSSNLFACYDVNEFAINLMLEAVHSMSVDNNSSVFTILDYGAADGGTSMPLMYACVRELRKKYGDELPIHVIYEDQPINDFKSLFRMLQGLIPGPPSFLVDFPNTFVTASGTSFYSQCVPDNSVTIGFSGTTFHWLRDKPCDITDAISYVASTVAQEKQKYREQAEKDWELILMKRAVELTPGGRLVFSQLTTDDDGVNKVCMHTQLSNLWKELCNEELITKEEFKNTVFIHYFRTIDEYKKPFQCKNSPVIQAGLRLIAMEKHVILCPLKQKWLKEKGDPMAHAKRFVCSLRAWSNGTFMSGLSDSRSFEAKSNIVDELYRRVENEVAQHPEHYGIDRVQVYMVIEKQK